MANVERREKVQDPFENNHTQKPKRLMRTPGQLPRSAFSKADDGAMIVDALTKFAEIGGGMYVNKMNQKIATDKVVQTGLAQGGYEPGDQATVAGLRAHSAVIMQERVMKSQLELNELAKQGCTDEEWKEAIKEKYEGTANYLQENYETYDRDPEMQKLLPLAFREIMPQLKNVRYAAKLEAINEDGKNAATDYIVNQATLLKDNKVKLDPAAMSDSITQKVKALKLSSKEKDDVVENALLKANSLELLEVAKVWMGDRKTNLFDRSGKLQSMERKLQNQKLSTEAVALETKTMSIKQGILDGSILIKDGMAMFDKMNKETGGAAVSRGYISSVWSDYYKARSAEMEMEKTKKCLSDPNFVDPGSMKASMKKAGLSSIYEDLLTKVEKDAEGLDDQQKEQVIAAGKKRAQAKVGDMAVRNNTVVQPFVNLLHNLATSNVDYTAAKDENDIPILGAVEKEGIALIDSLTPVALLQHLDALGQGGKEARVIRDYKAYRSRELSEPQALKQAQANLRNLPLAKPKDIQEGVESVRDNLEFLWNPDFEDRQAPYLEDQIRAQVALASDPASDANVDLVTEGFKKRWTQADGLWLKGSPEYLATQIGIEGDLKGRSAGKNSWLKDVMDAYTWSNKETFEPMLLGNGLEAEDVFPEVDTSKGTVRLVGRNKAFRANVYLTKPVPLSSLQPLMAKHKEHLLKKANERHEDAQKQYEKKMENLGLDKYM